MNPSLAKGGWQAGGCVQYLTGIAANRGES